MKISSLSYLIAAAALSLLSGCGGSTNGGTTADPTVLAAVAQSAPVADCEAEGCNRPRVIDRLAEQYRAEASAQQAPAPAGEPAQDASAQASNLAANDTVHSQIVEPNNPHNLPTNTDTPDNSANPATPTNPATPDQTANTTPDAATGQPQQAQ